VIFALAVSLILSLQLPAGIAAPQQPKAIIEGSVLRLDRGEPLARAEVSLTKVLPQPPPPPPGQEPAEPEQPAPIPAFHTEDDGKFTFKNLDAGQYRLRVMRNGFTTQQYGQRSTFGQGSIINVAEGQTVKNITVRLQQASTISGHILDAAGQPVPGILVSLSKTAYSFNGGQNLQQAGSALTDDRGEYRIFWVSPGRYVLSVSSETGMASYVFRRDNVVADQSYPTTYYPGTTDVSRASPLELQPGTELNSVDIVLTKPPAFRIKGTVVDAKTGQAPKNVDISLVPRQQPGGSKFQGDFSGNSVHYASGSFEINGVIPGSYWLIASQSADWNGPLPPGAAAAARTAEDLFAIAFQSLASAQIPVDIAANLDSVKLTLIPGLSVPVRMRVDGQDLSSVPGIDRVRLGLRPSDTGRQYNSDNRQPAPFTPEGVATIDNISPGEFRLTLANDYRQQSDFYIKEASVEGVDALNGWWSITGSIQGSLNVVLGNKPGQIEGTLVDAQSKPVSGAGVVLIPDQYRHRDELYRMADTDQDGHFTIRGIPPGSYKLFSWEDLEPFAYFNRDVLAKFEPQGRPVRIGESSKENVEVRMIPAVH